MTTSFLLRAASTVEAAASPEAKLIAAIQKEGVTLGKPVVVKAKELKAGFTSGKRWFTVKGGSSSLQDLSYAAQSVLGDKSTKIPSGEEWKARGALVQVGDSRFDQREADLTIYLK